MSDVRERAKARLGHNDGRTIPQTVLDKDEELIRDLLQALEQERERADENEQAYKGDFYDQLQATIRQQAEQIECLKAEIAKVDHRNPYVPEIVCAAENDRTGETR